MDFTKKLVKKRSKTRLAMDMMLEAYLTHDLQSRDPEDIPRTKEPVWILGKQYNAINDLEEIRRDIHSRLWFSYRKGFVQIGDSGLTSDKGWGCMLRCGQMLIGQALLFLHLGRDWRWSPQCRDRAYLRILRMFEDRRTAPYSIHQIALMGASEGKSVGEWFGPNTVAQVLRKLSAYDEWSSVAFHVAMDNTVVINDVRQLCTSETQRSDVRRRARSWKPLVLVVPLRLGITDINPVYVQAIKATFTFKQSLGVIGGKPNHALYFIGCVGNDVIFLDPHTTQSIGVVNGKEHQHEWKMDSSYHCNQASRLHILQMDPSVAVSFFCRTEAEFDSLCELIRKHMVTPDGQALIELSEEKQEHWTPVDDTAADALGATAMSFYHDRQFDDSDDDFELLG
ncbi:cysteine protease ATG4B-like [Macrosteles quadrilineatus]|uniref:cysteine protease ATG4B-like n=1 Tax=Macrosteles quadrilineatus TaxID=74068 RepID=UPI0023E185E6|nr:cysteine protease ATG4B-like [Macrosteles quadrilineatus]